MLSFKGLTTTSIVAFEFWTEIRQKRCMKVSHHHFTTLYTIFKYTHACVETRVHGLCVSYVERPPFGDVGVDASGSLVSLTVHLRYLLMTLGPLDVVPAIKRPYFDIVLC